MKATVGKGRFITVIVCLGFAVRIGAGSELSHPGASAASPSGSYSTPSGVPWG
jgi:hypothetical protein